MKTQLKKIACFSKGQQINGEQLLSNGKYDYLNGGIYPSGKWSDYNVEGDTIAISEGGNSCGYVNYMESNFWCGGHCYYLYDVKCSSKYLYYALKSQQDRIMKLRSGACMPNIKKKDLADFVFEYNDNSIVQKKVVLVLDTLESVILSKQLFVKKLDELIKSRFVEMFGDIYSNNHKYPVESLSDSILFLTSGSRGWAKYCVDSGREWFITIKNVKDCRISTDDIQAINAPKNAEAKRTRVNEGDLLISITADLGRTGVITKEIADHGAYINQHLTCIRLDKKRLNPLYVAYFLESESGKPQFEAKNQNGVKAGLNFDSIKTLRLLLPPIQIQNQFADFVTQVEKQKATVHQSIDKLETLKKSLILEYFG